MPTDGARRGSRSTSVTTDPALFWTYLLAALKTAVPGLGENALSLLESPQSPIEVVLSTLLNDLNGVSNDVVVVLDDYHVIDARDVLDEDGISAGAPASTDPPGDRRPRRPGIAVGAVARRGELVEIRAAVSASHLKGCRVRRGDAIGA